MFEGLSDWDLIEVMGEATRDESTAIAQRPRGRPRTTTSWPRKPSKRWASWRPASARSWNRLTPSSVSKVARADMEL